MDRWSQGECAMIERKRGNRFVRSSSNFRALFYTPLKPCIMEFGTIDKCQIIEAFEAISWLDHLPRILEKDRGDFPFLLVENRKNRNGVAVFAVDTNEWHTLYVRPKLVKRF